MKLQLAIDLLDQKEAAKLAQEVEEFIDIVEIGTPIVINEGLSAVEYMSKSVNNTQVLADLKIMDAAGYEISQAVKFGADIVTILGVGAEVVLLSTNPTSKIGELANAVIELPAGTKYDAESSAQPLGSLFEQASQVFLDSIVLDLMTELNVDEETMQQNHANLE